MSCAISDLLHSFTKKIDIVEYSIAVFLKFAGPTKNRGKIVTVQQKFQSCQSYVHHKYTEFTIIDMIGSSRKSMGLTEIGEEQDPLS